MDRQRRVVEDNALQRALALDLAMGAVPCERLQPAETAWLPLTRLPVTLEGELLATLPVGAHGWATLGGTVGLGPETTVSAASGGDSAELTVLVDRSTDPVDARILADALVGWVHHDDLEVLVGSVLKKQRKD